MPKLTADASPTPHVLDDPVRAALLGPHARFAESVGDVLRYPPEVTVFASMPSAPSGQDWIDAAKLVGPGGVLSTSWFDLTPPAGWESVFTLPGLQFVDAGIAAASDAEAVRLTAEDVPEMLALIAHAQPGPFFARTVEMGTYLGIRRAGRLVAMAGERLHPPGYTEISGVCTHADFRGEGLATRLVLAIADGIRRRGETPFLHTAASNEPANRLYTALGFELRRTVTFSGLLYQPAA